MSRAWRSAAKLLTKDEARRIFGKIAKLPELLREGDYCFNFPSHKKDA